MMMVMMLLLLLLFFGADEGIQAGVWEAVRSIGRRNYYR